MFGERTDRVSERTSRRSLRSPKMIDDRIRRLEEKLGQQIVDIDISNQIRLLKERFTRYFTLFTIQEPSCNLTVDEMAEIVMAKKKMIESYAVQASILDQMLIPEIEESIKMINCQEDLETVKTRAAEIEIEFWDSFKRSLLLLNRYYRLIDNCNQALVVGSTRNATCNG